MTKDKLLSAVSMARGAGRLKIGFDAAADAVLKGAPIVLLASDASDRTIRNILRICDENDAKAVELSRTQAEIEKTVGRKFAVAAVCDENFAVLIEKQIGEATGGLLNDNKI